MQNQLDELYKQYLNIILSDEEILNLIESYVLSSPQLLDVAAPRSNYTTSDYKVLFIGKETNGWFNQQERNEFNLVSIKGQNMEYLEVLKQIYIRQNIGEKEMSRAIFSFIDLAMDEIKVNSLSTGFLLSETLRHDYKCKGLPNHLALRIAFENNFILREEIKILAPDSLIFLTGPSYDEYIKLTFPKAIFKEYPEYEINQVSIIENIPDVKKALRIYHPGFHSRKGKDFRYEMADVIGKFLNN